MFRNLIFGSLLAPLGAALPIVALFLAGGLLMTVISVNPSALAMAVSISFYAIFGAYNFGWVAGLLIGAGNGLVWLFVKEDYKRILLAAPVGIVAVLLAFGWMAVSRSDALLSLLGFCVLGLIGSVFSAVLIAVGGNAPHTEAAPA